MDGGTAVRLHCDAGCPHSDAFCSCKLGFYKLAVQHLDQALGARCNPNALDTSILYSNRSAAHMMLDQPAQSLQDAEVCLVGLRTHLVPILSVALAHPNWRQVASHGMGQASAGPSMILDRG